MTAEDGVRKASNQFYDALNRMVNGDAAPMRDIWYSDTNVTTMHPVGGRQVGSNEVLNSWKDIAELSEDGEVNLNDQLIRTDGDLAYELGREQVKVTLAGKTVSSEVRVTNIYRRKEGSWKIVHHHTDTDKAMQEALKQTAVQ